MELRKAKRSTLFLKLGVAAPSGGGKTLGALLIAYGLMKEKYPSETDAFRWGKIGIIDTENGSGELYVGSEVAGIKIGEYNAITLNPPFDVEKYIQGMDLCLDNSLEVCIIDSSTHLWSGEGGLLDKQNVAAKRGGNSYTAWRDITPQHNKFVDKMLQSSIHVIATMRSKQEYVQEKDSNGKTTIRKLGLEPEQRKGMEYEFTTFFDIDTEHMAFGSKDRTSMFDQKLFKITPKTGQEIMAWLLNADTSEPEVIAVATHKASPEEALQAKKDEVVDLCRTAGGSQNPDLMKLLKKYDPEKGNPNNIGDVTKLSELVSELELLIAAQEVVSEEETD